MVNYVSYKGDKMGFRERTLKNKALRAVDVKKLNKSLHPLGHFINQRIDHLRSARENAPMKERGARRGLAIIKELKATLKSLRKAI